jgi:tetratricopeptide (TPR) repeat protein
MKHIGLPFFTFFLIVLTLLSCDNKHTKYTTTSSDLLLQKAENSLENHPDSTLLITQKVLSMLPKNTLDDKEQLRIYQLREKAFSMVQNIDSVWASGEQVRKIASKIPDSLAFAQSLLVTVKGNLDYSFNKKLEKYIPSAISFFKKRNSLFEMSLLKANYAALLINEGEYKKAQEYLLQSYKVFVQLKKPIEQAKISNLIGTNYGYMGSQKESFKYYQEALSIAQNYKDSLLMSIIHTNLGIYYRKLNPESAINEYNKSLSYIPNESKSLDRIKINYNLANVFYDKGDYNSAEKVYLNMVSECKVHKFIEGTAMAFNGLASVYNETGRQEKAIFYMLNAVHVADSLGMTNLSLMLKPELISIYKKSGDYKKALDQSEQMKSLSDSILSKEKQRAVHELEIKYNSIKNKQKNKYLQHVISARQNTIFGLIGVVGLLLSLVFVYRQRSLLLKERNKAYDILMRKYKADLEVGKEVELKRVTFNNEQKLSLTEDLYEKLISYYQKEKPYLNAKLKAFEVANVLRVSQREISAVIKANGFNGFTNFNNKFRIEEVKRQFADSAKANLKMETIAKQSGFGSRQSFYTAFEEFTGVNPGFYRSEILK